ncbi:hypothetical protein BHM03_00046654 [Ensete ventricosum]|nr:hypothetical protein BHM03_00046654 [Ensete ventricosum]
MRLGTRQECIGSSSRVLEVCQDGSREFARRRPRLAGRLSGVAESLSGLASCRFNHDGRRSYRSDMDPGSSLGIGPGSDDAMGPCWEFARRFVEGIRKLARNTLGDHRRKTVRLTAVESGGCRVVGVRS